MFDQVTLEKTSVGKRDSTSLRHLIFTGTRNFRDLGGYRTADGLSVRWNLLYRSDALHKLTDGDLKKLAALGLDRIFDFRAEQETEHEPDRLPADLDIRLVKIPILDSSTQVWHNSREEFVKNLKNVDPVPYMIRTNVEFVTRFTPQFKLFLHEVLSASGRPVLFHCAAGKDRTGFAAAILLRILGVPQTVIMEDYLLTNKYFYGAYKWNLMLARLIKGKRFAAVVRGFMDARPEYLSAALDAIDREYGSFDAYLRNGLGVTGQEIERLKSVYLE